MWGCGLRSSFETLPKIIYVGRAKGLDTIIDQGTHISIGASATYADAEISSRVD